MIATADKDNLGDPIMKGVVAAVRATAKGTLPADIEPNQSFLLDLGFDSMSIAVLGLALEDQFHQAVLLDGWIAQHSEPAELTVGSLCDYLRSAL
jgi:acyl carrier protein